MIQRDWIAMVMERHGLDGLEGGRMTLALHPGDTHTTQIDGDTGIAVVCHLFANNPPDTATAIVFVAVSNVRAHQRVLREGGLIQFTIDRISPTPVEFRYNWHPGNAHVVTITTFRRLAPIVGKAGIMLSSAIQAGHVQWLKPVNALMLPFYRRGAPHDKPTDVFPLVFDRVTGQPLDEQAAKAIMDSWANNHDRSLDDGAVEGAHRATTTEWLH